MTRFVFISDAYLPASSSNSHKSLVAILILEVTGIPELSANREFPWAKPGFIESTTGFVFEVSACFVSFGGIWKTLTFLLVSQLSVFENHECEYVYPEGLYVARLKALESALRERSDPYGLGVSAYFAPERGREDSEMESSTGHVVSLIPEEESSSDPHMAGSGFGVVRVDFGGGWADDFSPWDLCMPDLSISRPQLSDEDKKLVLEKLDVQCQKYEVAQHFNLGVDTSRYCDYEKMVEVEMFLMMVKRRLGKDYYASKFAVVQDLRLIRDNCIKYNGNEHELVAIAKRLCTEFESTLLSEEEASFLRESDTLTLSRDRSTESRRTTTIRINLRQRRSHVSAHEHQPSHGRASRQSHMQRQSSLENLPAPDAVRRVQPTRRGRARTDEAMATSRHGSVSSQGRALRPRNVHNLESLSRLGTNGARSASAAESRSSRYARRQAAGHAAQENTGTIGEGNEERVAGNASTLRRPTRSGRSSNRYADFENSGVEQAGPEARTQRSSGRAARSGRSNIRYADFENSDVDDAEKDARPQRSSAGATRSGRSSTRFADVEHLEVEEAGEDARPQRSTRRAARPVARTNVRVEDSAEENSSEESEEQPEEDESDNSSVPQYMTRRGSSRAASRLPRRAPPSGARSARSRASPRPGAQPIASYDDPSNSESDDGVIDDGSDEEVHIPRARKSMIRSYAEVPSDYDEEESEGELSVHESPSRRKSVHKRKSAGKHISGKLPSFPRVSSTIGPHSFLLCSASPSNRPATKKPKVAKVDKISKKSKAAMVERRSLKTWPSIPLKDITRVSKEVLAKVAAEDVDGHFSTPVLESYPHLSGDYMAAVDVPMDFRTIDEERIPKYKSIKDLQRDLFLIFDNCSQFNGAGTEMGQYAMYARWRNMTCFASFCNAILTFFSSISQQNSQSTE